MLRDEEPPRLRIDLRDDLDMPVSAAEVRITVEGEPPFSARTDARGAIAIPLEPAWRDRGVRVAFGGDAHLDPSERELGAGDARARVELVPTLDRPGILPLDEGPQVIRLHARARVGASGLLVRVQDERGRLLAAAKTDALGRAHLAIASHDLGEPGPGRLRFESEANETHRAASIVLPVLRALASTLALDDPPRTIRPGHALVVRGSLSTARGALADEPVSLVVDGETAAEAVTDAEGRFRLELAPRDDLPPSLAASVRFSGSDRRGAEPVESAPFVMVTRAPAPTWPYVALSLAFVSALSLLRRRRLEVVPEGKPPRRTLRALFERPSRALRVRITASRDGLPVAGATLRVDGDVVGTSDARGEIASVELPSGAFELVIEAAGFVPYAMGIVVPSRGLGSLEVSLIETREAATRALAEVALRRGASRERVAASTHRELGRHIERAQGELDALVGDVDEAYYGPETPDEARVRAIEERARRHRD